MRPIGLIGLGLLLGLSPALMAPALSGCPDCLLHAPDKEILVGNWYTFDVEIPGGMRGDFIVRPSDGNPDLYCLDKTGVSPTNYICGPQKTGLEEEVCTFEPTSTTTYHCVVEANGADSKFTLWVTEADSGCHSGSPGNASHCSASCTCGYELGGCANHSDCGGGLECIPDQGADFGWDPKTDVCL